MPLAGKIKFYREVEIKHGRVAMLASVGFLVAEQFHPLFGGGINVPSIVAFQQTPLQGSLTVIAAVIGFLEVLSIFTFNSCVCLRRERMMLRAAWVLLALITRSRRSSIDAHLPRAHSPGRARQAIRRRVVEHPQRLRQR